MYLYLKDVYVYKSMCDVVRANVINIIAFYTSKLFSIVDVDHTYFYLNFIVLNIRFIIMINSFKLIAIESIYFDTIYNCKNKFNGFHIIVCFSSQRLKNIFHQYYFSLFLIPHCWHNIVLQCIQTQFFQPILYSAPL